jgi:hypothetical protein
MRGYGLNTEAGVELLTEWQSLPQHFERLSTAEVEARIQEAKVDAGSPLGYMLPQASGDNGLDSFDVKRPGEVSESDRKTAETKLMALLAEMDGLKSGEARSAFWAIHKDEVADLSKTETTRSLNWLGLFCGLLPDNHEVFAAQYQHPPRGRDPLTQKGSIAKALASLGQA